MGKGSVQWSVHLPADPRQPIFRREVWFTRYGKREHVTLFPVFFNPLKNT